MYCRQDVAEPTAVPLLSVAERHCGHFHRAKQRAVVPWAWCLYPVLTKREEPGYPPAPELSGGLDSAYTPECRSNTFISHLMDVWRIQPIRMPSNLGFASLQREQRVWRTQCSREQVEGV